MKRQLRAESERQARWLSRNVIGFSLASLFSDMGHELVTALLPGFLVTLGAPPAALGLIEGVSNFGQSLAEIWGGRKADSALNRAPWIYGGYVATMLKAAIALVPVWPWIVAIRCVAWLGRGARGPLRDALIADDVDPRHWGKAYGFREALDTAGAVVGPLLAAVLLTHLHYRLLIGLSVIPAVLTIVIVVAMVREVPHRLQRPPGISPRPASYSPIFRRFLLGATLFSIGYAAPTFFILRAIQLLGSRGVVEAGSVAIALYTVHNLFYALASYPSGAITSRVAPRHLLIVGYLLWVLVLAGFAVSRANVVLLGILFLASGTATALIETVQTTWSARLLPDESRGRGLGLLSGCTGFGQLASGLLVGTLWTQGGAPLAFTAAAVASLVGFLVTRTISPDEVRD